jgi:hypothetical protein
VARRDLVRVVAGEHLLPGRGEVRGAEHGGGAAGRRVKKSSRGVSQPPGQGRPGGGGTHFG